MKIDIKILEEYVLNGLLRKQCHPKYGLIIWNYTPTVSYGKLWDEITIQCRGLITDSNGNIVAKCLDKFFNYEELKPDDIPNESFTVTDKMDGSYINLFEYNSEWIISSRGSFISDQSVLAKQIFDEKYKNKVLLNKNYNYILEVIGKDNVIVLIYPENDLILLACTSRETGEEIDIYNDEFNGFNWVKIYDGINDYKVLKQLISDDKEGYVIKFKSGLRMKIKGSNYCRLHNIVTNISNVGIWEMLKDGKDLSEIIEEIPDETYDKIKLIISELKSLYSSIEATSLTQYNRIYYGDGKRERKEFALDALKSDFSGILFNIYNKKDYSEQIWKLIKPKFCKL